MKSEFFCPVALTPNDKHGFKAVGCLCRSHLSAGWASGNAASCLRPFKWLYFRARSPLVALGPPQRPDSLLSRVPRPTLGCLPAQSLLQLEPGPPDSQDVCFCGVLLLRKSSEGIT